MKFGEWRPQKGYLPALSVRQPHAWLIVQQAVYPSPKTIENREWRTSYRGPLLIHAGKEVDPHFFQKHDVYFPDAWRRLHPGLEAIMPGTRDAYPTFGIVGICELVDVVEQSYLTEGTPWFGGPYGFVLRDARPLPFVAYKGTLGLFSVPESLLTGVGETTLRARNIPEPVSPDLDEAYALTQEIAKAEAAKPPPAVADFWAMTPEQQYQVQQRLRQERKPGRCVIKINGRRV